MVNISDTVYKDFHTNSSSINFKINFLENISNIIPKNAQLMGINDYYEVWSTDTDVYYQYSPYLIRKYDGSAVTIYQSKEIPFSSLYGILRGGITEKFRDDLLKDSLIGIHASMVYKDDDVKIFIGSKGSGKTSVALNLVHQGYTLLTDEFISIDQSGHLHWLYRSPGIYEYDIEKFFPFVRNLVWSESKSIVNNEKKSLLQFPEQNIPLNINIFNDVTIFFLTSNMTQTSDKKNFIQSFQSQIIDGHGAYKYKSHILDYIFDNMIISNVLQINNKE